MKCPGCSETNEAGMQFCIYCGSSLAVPTTVQSAPPLSGAPIVEDLNRISSSNQSIALFCTVCHKSDPLNGQFCVYCGGRTVPGPSPVGTGQVPFMPSSSQSTVSTPLVDYRNTGEEIRQSPAVTLPARKSGMGFLSLVLSGILGLALGFGAVFYMKGELEKSVLSSFWPDEGALVLSNLPSADLKIEDVKKKVIIFGRTSSKGSLHVANLSPGEFVMSLSDKSPAGFKQTFGVNAGECSVIGYPQKVGVK